MHRKLLTIESKTIQDFYCGRDSAARLLEPFYGTLVVDMKSASTRADGMIRVLAATLARTLNVSLDPQVGPQLNFGNDRKTRARRIVDPQ